MCVDGRIGPTGHGQPVRDHHTAHPDAQQERKNIFTAMRNAALTLLASPFYSLIVIGGATLLLVVSALLVALLFLGGE